MRQWERDRSCFDHLSPCMSQFYCWLPRRIRQQRRGYTSAGMCTRAEADFPPTESTRKQVPCGPGERSRQSHMGQGLPPICIRPAIRFIANAPLATRAGVVSSVVVRAIPSKKAMTSYAPHVLGPQHLALAIVLAVGFVLESSPSRELHAEREGPQNRGRHAINVVTVLTRPSVGYAKFFGRIPRQDPIRQVLRQSLCDGPDQHSARRRSGPMSPVIITLLVLLGVGLLLALWLMY